MNSEELKLIKEMMDDAKNQSNLHLPGNYWKYYEKNILKQIKKNDLTKFRSWPGGAGTGFLASCFLKLKKNIKYLIVDIPPTLFFSEYYLRNLGFKVFGYKDLKTKKNANLNEIFNHYQVCCIPPWKLELLKDYKSDLFINIASFQEIEKEQSINYINIFKNCINKYIYFENGVKYNFTTPQKGEFGVLNPTSKFDLENELTDMFQIKYSRTDGNFYKTLFEKKGF